MKRTVLPLLVLGFLAGGLPAQASPPPADNPHFCWPLDIQSGPFEVPAPAAKPQADLNVGEPRTVRMIYFLPNDGVFRQEQVDALKATIGKVQSFFVDQMEAHGHGKRTLRIETDAEGEPLVHRVVGQHPDSHYLEDTQVAYREIEQFFDLNENVYMILADLSTSTIGLGNGRTVAGIGWGYKKGGQALVSPPVYFQLIAHELGHAFGLDHDFRDRAYIMSYGPGQGQLSACAAEFLAVHPYFNPDSPLEIDWEGAPTVELVSPRTFGADATSVPVRVNVSDSDGVRHVTMVQTSVWGRAGEILGCRGLDGQSHAAVEFEYDGSQPSRPSLRLFDRAIHQILVRAVDAGGNWGWKTLQLLDTSHLIAALADQAFKVETVSFWELYR